MSLWDCHRFDYFRYFIGSSVTQPCVWQTQNNARNNVRYENDFFFHSKIKIIYGKGQQFAFENCICKLVAFFGGHIEVGMVKQINLKWNSILASNCLCLQCTICTSLDHISNE